MAPLPPPPSAGAFLSSSDDQFQISAWLLLPASLSSVNSLNTNLNTLNTDFNSQHSVQRNAIHNSSSRNILQLSKNICKVFKYF